jgi:hypothetical protein
VKWLHTAFQLLSEAHYLPPANLDNDLPASAFPDTETLTIVETLFHTCPRTKTSIDSPHSIVAGTTRHIAMPFPQISTPHPNHGTFWRDDDPSISPRYSAPVHLDPHHYTPIPTPISRPIPPSSPYRPLVSASVSASVSGSGSVSALISAQRVQGHTRHRSLPEHFCKSCKISHGRIPHTATAKSECKSKSKATMYFHPSSYPVQRSSSLKTAGQPRTPWTARPVRTTSPSASRSHHHTGTVDDSHRKKLWAPDLTMSPLNNIDIDLPTCRPFPTTATGRPAQPASASASATASPSTSAVSMRMMSPSPLSPLARLAITFDRSSLGSAQSGIHRAYQPTRWGMPLTHDHDHDQRKQAQASASVSAEAIARVNVTSPSTAILPAMKSKRTRPRLLKIHGSSFGSIPDEVSLSEAGANTNIDGDSGTNDNVKTAQATNDGTRCVRDPSDDNFIMTATASTATSTATARGRAVPIHTRHGDAQIVTTDPLQSLGSAMSSLGSMTSMDSSIASVPEPKTPFTSSTARLLHVVQPVTKMVSPYDLSAKSKDPYGHGRGTDHDIEVGYVYDDRMI